MIYFLVTTCLLNHDFERRKSEYIQGIQSLLRASRDIKNKKIIIIENNGKRETFLDEFSSASVSVSGGADADCDVFYTNNNEIKFQNKGVNELMDIIDAIEAYNIQDDDFIVKFTGRYFIEEDSNFFKHLKMDNFETNFDALIKYGSYERPVNGRKNDCITGLIGMKCKFVKEIKLPHKSFICVEWNYANASFLIDDDDRVIAIQDRLGLIMKVSFADDLYYI